MHRTEDTTAPLQQVAIVTGPSGAGRSTAIAALEDLGFEAIDNLPLSLLERLFAGGAHDHPVAVGIDPRTRDFSADGLLAAIDGLNAMPGFEASLVFIDCDTDTLLRRFSETRRRHPLAPQEPPLSGIERERTLLLPVLPQADVLIDTTEMTPHDLRAEMGRWFARGDGGDMVVVVQSFSYKRGTPRSADMVLDCRFLRNPHWVARLRPFTGQDAEVASYVAGDALYAPFMEKVIDMVTLLLPAYKAEGKSYFTLAFGCTGGRHRSVCIAQEVAIALAKAGWRVSSRHRELERAPREGVLEGVVKT
ncbi:RNase adapter RapZ [Halovulum dunhuangense]|uniref:RNase adapter RapZ n=1 Tax=Halovulum dunhuangense TaxID=1505036 RepID=A0A849L5V5_9RHOB|nr:RNase adapter RapZ [Halovulum dunhuangense]NNU81540.1 RNase adapter RapZ [Halovulum dunhuangense]